jgi:hypothetical protein
MSNATLLRQTQDALAMAVQADLEHGVKWLNEQAAEEFARKYPNLNQVIGNIMEMDVVDDDTDGV